MLDPDEVADYEAWKQSRLVGALDLSVSAYNLEIESNALAWEDGWRDCAAGVKFADNKFRKPGMRAERIDPDVAQKQEEEGGA